ncbi:uncharacterized protein LOC144104830 isoform X2 [Amblyomma americanum]
MDFAGFGEWHLVHRNFYEDFTFGGNIKSLKSLRHPGYGEFGSPVILSYHDEESTSGSLTLSSTEGYKAKNILRFNFCHDNRTAETHVIFKKHHTCLILRHPNIMSGFGCSFWRHSSAAAKESNCCEFIYDQNCGTTPKYGTKQRKTCPRGRSCARRLKP